MRVLCVAEKPSIAKSIAQILSGGQYTTVSMKHIDRVVYSLRLWKAQHLLQVHQEL